MEGVGELRRASKYSSTLTPSTATNSPVSTRWARWPCRCASSGTASFRRPGSVVTGGSRRRQHRTHDQLGLGVIPAERGGMSGIYLLWRLIAFMLWFGTAFAVATVIIAVALMAVIIAVVYGSAPSRTVSGQLSWLFLNTREGIAHVQALKPTLVPDPGPSDDPYVANAIAGWGVAAEVEAIVRCDGCRHPKPATLRRAGRAAPPRLKQPRRCRGRMARRAAAPTRASRVDARICGGAGRGETRSAVRWCDATTGRAAESGPKLRERHRRPSAAGDVPLVGSRSTWLTCSRPARWICGVLAVRFPSSWRPVLYSRV